MPKSIAPVLIGAAVAIVVSFLMNFAAAFAGDKPGITGVAVSVALGAITTVIVNNLSGNRKVADADRAARSQALAFQPTPGAAGLYLMRTGFVGMAAGMNIAIDGRKVAQLKAPRFTRVDVAPGAHVVKAAFGGGLAGQTRPSELQVTLAPGELALIKITMGMGAMKNPIKIEQIPLDGMKSQLAGMRMSAPDVAAV